jgi:hypothetical protein
LSCGIGCYDYVGSPGFFDELFFVLISENDKWSYIRDYHEKEGILLDYNNIKKNPGLRALAKLMLNSFWGKFGQRSNMPRIKYIYRTTYPFSNAFFNSSVTHVPVNDLSSSLC